MCGAVCFVFMRVGRGVWECECRGRWRDVVEDESGQRVSRALQGDHREPNTVGNRES